MDISELETPGFKIVDDDDEGEDEDDEVEEEVDNTHKAKKHKSKLRLRPDLRLLIAAINEIVFK